MRTSGQRIVRGAATAAGALALALVGVACTDTEESATPGPSAASDPAPEADEGTTQSPDARSDGGGQGPFDQEELDAASQRFVELLHVLDDQDWEAACGMVLDPSTGTAPEGERLQECADGVEPVFAELTEQLEPGAFDAVDASMIEAADEGDGTVTLSVLGQDLDVPMVPGEDGRWYLAIPF